MPRTDLDDDLPAPAATEQPLERWFVRCVWACACLAPAWAALGTGL